MAKQPFRGIDSANAFINALLFLMSQKGSSLITIPDAFKDKVDAVRLMLKNDNSGLVGSIRNYAINCASTKYEIEVDNDSLYKILNRWAKKGLNRDFGGKIPPGINELAKEYFKERWTSSFIVMAVSGWSNFDGIELPSKIYFFDGGGIGVKGNEGSLANYEYHLLSDKKKKDLPYGGINDIIVQKPYSQWYEKYPTPFTIARGIYWNHRLKQILKDKGKEIISECMPYLLLVKMGDKMLERFNQNKAGSKQFKDAKNKLKEVIQEAKRNPDKTPSWFTSQDKEIEHIIPDLAKAVNRELFVEIDRDIIAGWGLIEVMEGIGATRKEAVVNPKMFITEVNSAVEDFKSMFNQLLQLIAEKNRNKKIKTGAVDHRKYFGDDNDLELVSRPLKGFITNEFRELIRDLYTKGVLGYQTVQDLGVDIDYRSEKRRRKKENKEGARKIFYPNVHQNIEGTPSLPEEFDKNGKPIPEEKRSPETKEKYTISNLITALAKLLEIAPYKTLKDLPDYIKELPIGKQKIWMKAFNYAWERFKNLPLKKRESRCFKYANGVLKKIKKKK